MTRQFKSRSKHRVAMLARIISQSLMRTTESNGIIVPGNNENETMRVTAMINGDDKIDDDDENDDI